MMMNMTMNVFQRIFLLSTYLPEVRLDDLIKPTGSCVGGWKLLPIQATKPTVLEDAYVHQWMSYGKDDDHPKSI